MAGVAEGGWGGQDSQGGSSGRAGGGWRRWQDCRDR